MFSGQRPKNPNIIDNNENFQRGFAEVITWGSKYKGGNGLSKQIQAKLFGGNVGHVAIR
jgi:hypothetical protein